jgi:hypothetical protein
VFSDPPFYPHHFPTTPPVVSCGVWGLPSLSCPFNSPCFFERDTGFEPATSSLGSWHSTN